MERENFDLNSKYICGACGWDGTLYISLYGMAENKEITKCHYFKEILDDYCATPLCDLGPDITSLPYNNFSRLCSVKLHNPDFTKEGER